MLITCYGPNGDVHRMLGCRDTRHGRMYSMLTHHFSTAVGHGGLHATSVRARAAMPSGYVSCVFSCDQHLLAGKVTAKGVNDSKNALKFQVYITLTTCNAVSVLPGTALHRPETGEPGMVCKHEGMCMWMLRSTVCGSKLYSCSLVRVAAVVVATARCSHQLFAASVSTIHAWHTCGKHRQASQ